MYPRLDSSQLRRGTEIQEGQEQTITSLFQQQTQQHEEKKEISLKEYVDIQDNNVVAFVINWIKTKFIRDVMDYLNTEFKQNIINEMKK